MRIRGLNISTVVAYRVRSYGSHLRRRGKAAIAFYRAICCISLTSKVQFFYAYAQRNKGDG